MKTLVIVESPSKAKTIEKYLGKDYHVISSKGHIRDLPPDELGVDIEASFEPKFTLMRGKEKVVQQIKEEARNKPVLLASDMDREGEAIAWHLAQILSLSDQETNRVLFSEITEKAIKAAIKRPLRINRSKVEAQFARRILDRLVGYQISPFLWKVIQVKSLSAGRVQSVALRFICDLEEKILTFVPEEYWKFKARFLCEKMQGELETALVSVDGISLEKQPIRNVQDAMKIEEEILKSSFAVRSVEEKVINRKPPAPFITSTLQQEASNRLGFSVSRTMKVAQELYEGLETKDGPLAFITYMRTDSNRISEEALEAAKLYITEHFGESHSKTQRYGKNKANTQDAHEAIRPTYPDVDPQKAEKMLSADQAKLYRLIWSRFMASQMIPAVYRQTKIKIEDIEQGRYTFEAEGARCVEEGYEKVYPPTSKEKDLSVVPVAGTPASLSHFEKAQNFTTPPARFTEASLVKKLEKEGIGRPSTYASIIHTLLERHYAYREQKSLVPTFLGMIVNHFMSDFFPKIIQAKFTASMEENLDKVEEGEENWKEAIQRFYSDFEPTLLKLKEKTLTKSLNWLFSTNLPCKENEKHTLILKMGRFGPYLRCEACDKNYSISEKAKIIFRQNQAEIYGETVLENSKEVVAIGRACPKCGGDLVERQGRYGKFIACSNYPKCKYTENVDEKVAAKCPKCGADVVSKKSKRGRTFFACKNNAYNGGTCDFFSWYEPTEEKCPQCGQTMVLKKGRSGEERIVCESCARTTRIAKKTK